MSDLIMVNEKLPSAHEKLDYLPEKSEDLDTQADTKSMSKNQIAVPVDNDDDDITPWEFPEIIQPHETLSYTTCIDQILNPDAISLLVDEYVKEIGRDGKITVYQLKSNHNHKPSHEQKNRSYIPPWETPDRFKKISDIFDKLRKPIEEDDVEVLYQCGPQMESKEDVDITFRRELETIQLRAENTEAFVDNFKNLPQSFMENLSYLLDNKSRTQCREVCKNWNKQISCSDAFLNKAVFIMGPTLELVQRCKKTQVKWRNIKCQLLPCPEFYSTKSYQQKYIVNKLVRGPKTFFTASIHSITLDRFEIQKENLIKWLTLCTQVTKLEFCGCTFKKSKASWAKETLQKVSDRIKEFRIRDMTLFNIVDAGKLLLMFSRKLKVLELSQKGVDHSVSELSSLRIKTLEEDFATIVISAMEVNIRSMKSLGIAAETFQNEKLLSKIFYKVGDFGLNLHDFHFDIRPPGQEINNNVAPSSLGPNPLKTIQIILKSSPEIRKLRVPYLNLDFSELDDISWTFPSTICELETQVKTPMKENEIKYKIRQRFNLKSMRLHGQMFTDLDWIDFRQCHPWLTDLQICCPNITDIQMQSVIQNMSSLYSLTFDHVKDATDFGITGLEAKLLQKMEYLWSEKGVDGFSDPTFKLKHSGLPLASMKWLKSFKCRGEYKFTDIGLRYGLMCPNLEVLELSGSELIVSESGLQVLASNCPKLKYLSIQLSRKSMHSKSIEDLTKQMRSMPNKGIHIKYTSN